jgi:hypothetical protein
MYSEGYTVNKQMYVEILCYLRSAVRRNVWKNVHETVGFFCMTMYLHIGLWWSQCDGFGTSDIFSELVTA